MFDEKDFMELGNDFDLGGEADDIEALFGSDDASDGTLTAQTEEKTAVQNTANAVGQEVAVTTQEEKKEEKADEAQIGVSEGAAVSADKTQDGEDEDPFAAIIAQADEKQAEDTKNSLAKKLPIFVFAKASEEISDPTITFDKLREEKAEDFGELDDAKKVSWKMIYGSITKNVPNPDITTIAEFKKKIERSKAFQDSLKNAKEELVCKVKPTVSAGSKGTGKSYKGIFGSVDAAVKSGKEICYVPSDDGNVYEVRCNRIGTFIAKADRVSILPKVRVGFRPALPKIPYDILSQIISFFRSYVTCEYTSEALAHIYWSWEKEKYFVHIPLQKVSKDRVDTVLDEVDEKKYTRVMEIHSHNTMNAFFSPTDDADECAVMLYAVVGRLDGMFPDIKVRMSVNGKFIELNALQIFEIPDIAFPAEWHNSILEMEGEICGLQKTDL